MSAAVFLVTDFLFKTPLTAVVTAAVVAVFAWFWYGLPCGGRRGSRAKGGKRRIGAGLRARATVSARFSTAYERAGSAVMVAKGHSPLGSRMG